MKFQMFLITVFVSSTTIYCEGNREYGFINDDETEAVVRLSVAIENDPDGYSYAHKKINSVHQGYYKWLQSRKTGPATMPKELEFDKNSPYSILASKLASSLLLSGMRNGSGIGCVTIQTNTEVKYSVTFTRVLKRSVDEQEVGLTWASDAEELKHTMESALAEIYQDGVDSVAIDFADMETAKKKPPSYDPNFEFRCGNENFIVMRRKLCISDIHLFTSDKHEGIGIGVAGNDVSEMVAFLYYEKPERVPLFFDPTQSYHITKEHLRQPIYQIARNLFADELAGKILATETTNQGNEVLAFGLGSRYSVGYSWTTSDLAKPDLSTNFIDCFKKNLDGRIINGNLEFQEDDEFDFDGYGETTFLRIKSGLGVQQIWDNAENGFGVGVAVGSGGWKVQVFLSFSSTHFEFGDTFKTINTIRERYKTNALETNFITSAKLNQEARKIATKEIERIKRGPNDLHAGILAGRNYVATFGWADFVSYSSNLKQMVDQISMVSIERRDFNLEGLLDTLLPLDGPGIVEVQNVVYVCKGRSNADLVHLLSEKLEGIGLADLEHDNKVMSVLFCSLTSADLEGEGIYRLLLQKHKLEANTIVKVATPYATALNFLERQLFFAVHANYIKTNVLNEVATALGKNLLEKRVETSGFGLGQSSILGTNPDYAAVYVRLDFTQVPQPRLGPTDTYEDALAKSALKIAFNTLCRDGVAAPLAGAKSEPLYVMPKPKPVEPFFSPSFEQEFTNFVIMRNGTYSLDLNKLMSAGSDYGVSVVRSNEAALSGRSSFMVVFVVPKGDVFTSNKLFRENMTSLAMAVKPKDSPPDIYSLRNFCLCVLAHDFLLNARNEGFWFGCSGFGAANGFTVAYEFVTLIPRWKETPEALEHEAILKFVSAMDAKTGTNTEHAFKIEDFDFNFKWKGDKYPVQTYLPFSKASRSPWDSNQKNEGTLEDFGIAVKRTSSFPLTFLVVMVFAQRASLCSDVKSHVNVLRRQSMRNNYFPLNESSIYSIALRVVARHVAKSIVVPPLMEPKQQTLSSFGQGNEYTAITISDKSEIVSNKILSHLFKKLTNKNGIPLCKELLPNIIDYAEDVQPECTLKPNQLLNFLPVWKKGTDFDVLQLLRDGPIGIGCWAGNVNGSNIMVIVSYSPSSLLKTNKLLSTINQLRPKNNLLNSACFMSPQLNSIGRELVYLLKECKSIYPGYGYGGNFKATYIRYTGIEIPPAQFISENLAKFVSDLFNSTTNVSSDFFQANLSFTTSPAVSGKSRKFTLITWGQRCKDDIKDVFLPSTSRIGIVAEICEDEVWLVLVTPMERKGFMTNEIFQNVNNLRGLAKPPFSRTSSLAAVLDELATRVAKKLATNVLAMEQTGQGVGKDFIAFYSAFTIESEVKQTNFDKELKAFLNYVLNNHRKLDEDSLPNLLEYVDDDITQFLWNDANDGLSEMLPRWKLISNWAISEIVSGRTIDVGISAIVDGKRIVLVALFYAPTPYLGADECLFENIAKKHKNVTLKEKGITQVNFISATLNAVADDLGHKLIAQTDLKEGFGVGKGFTAAFRRVYLGKGLNNDAQAIIELDDFLSRKINQDGTPRRGICPSLTDAVGPIPLENEFDSNFTWQKSDLTQTPLSNFFVPISYQRSSRDFLQLIASSTTALGLGVGIDPKNGIFMVVVLCPWAGNNALPEHVLKNINHYRDTEYHFDRFISSCFALDYIAHEINENYLKLSGYFEDGRNLAWTIIREEDITQSGSVITEEIELTQESCKNTLNSSTLEAPFLEAALSLIFSKRFEYNQVHCVPQSAKSQAGAPLLQKSFQSAVGISTLDYTQAVWKTSKWIGICVQETSLVLVYSQRGNELTEGETYEENAPKNLPSNLMQQ